mmetsp:Transcript_38624/g.70262  ORF Transcript_38624/g.70262 Transcript_38624/m.70262 type:complete len:316 (-) Transcript_38624:21-968(-)
MALCEEPGHHSAAAETGPDAEALFSGTVAMTNGKLQLGCLPVEHAELAKKLAQASVEVIQGVYIGSGGAGGAKRYSEIGNGSGFVVKKGKKHFLFTARHCLYNEVPPSGPGVQKKPSSALKRPSSVMQKGPHNGRQVQGPQMWKAAPLVYLGAYGTGLKPVLATPAKAQFHKCSDQDVYVMKVTKSNFPKTVAPLDVKDMVIGHSLAGAGGVTLIGSYFKVTGKSKYKDLIKPHLQQIRSNYILARAGGIVSSGTRSKRAHKCSSSGGMSGGGIIGTYKNEAKVIALHTGREGRSHNLMARLPPTRATPDSTGST